MRMSLGRCHCAREEATDHWFRKAKFSRPDTGPSGFLIMRQVWYYAPTQGDHGYANQTHKAQSYVF
jgi:hypothetical protein